MSLWQQNAYDLWEPLESEMYLFFIIAFHGGSMFTFIQDISWEPSEVK